MKNVLHITPYFFGGPAKALSAFVIEAKKTGSRYHHTIVTLEETNNMRFINALEREGVPIFLYKDVENIDLFISTFDIVQIEWWNHPKIFSFFQKLKEISARVIFWSHTSGCFYPYMSIQLISTIDFMVFTSAYSWENPTWNNEDKKMIRGKTEVIYGTGGVDNINLIKREDDKFRIGYTGTIDFVKLNRKFIKFCSMVDIEKSCFILVGSDENKETLLEEASKYGIESKFFFTGFVEDIYQELIKFDIYSYLLEPTHYGTTDNALLEAMASGLPIITLNQCGEKYVIEDGKSGILVNSEIEYKNAVRYLYQHPAERVRLGMNARKRVFREFSVQSTVEKFNDVYNRVMKVNKEKHNIFKIVGEDPYSWFLYGLGNNKKLLDGKDKVTLRKYGDILFFSKKKSSLIHFLETYPYDKKLIALYKRIYNLMNGK